MKRALFSPAARSDLDRIWDFTVAHWGVAQSELYLRVIETATRLIAEDPHVGRTCDDVRAGYSKYPAGSHLLYYRTTARAVHVNRVLHQRMDPERHL